ncbi:MAG TPA: sigma-70 family RNA polymerase sigma factor [Candidatus Gracilibacteria bacterium]|nr:sigma-70 family RNA polymerase sigma factor [Candidatus Gracilibacteria bacterium]
MLEQERKLVEDAKQDPQKFAALYDKYFDQIYRYVYRRVSDKETVNDIVSQTFYDALSHMKSYEWRGFSFSAWLYKIAHNNVLKWYREVGKMHVVDIEEGQQIPDKTVDHVGDLRQKELKDEIQGVLDRLEYEEREIIRLKFFEEVSNIEIAEIMGLSANHIGVKVFRALKKVKQLISQ